MSFTYHWPNRTTELYRDRTPRSRYASGDNRLTPVDYHEKIGSLVPAVCLQADVLYPNAYAYVCTEGGGSRDGTTGLVACPGCKGHQVDEEFPLVLRTPTAVPFVQYKNDFEKREDMCKIPVLNWENYVQEFAKGMKNHFMWCTNKWASRKKCNKNETEVQEGAITEHVDQDEHPIELAAAAVDEETDISNLNTPKNIPASLIQKFKNVPEVRVEGTWNFYYNHGGACELVQDEDSDSGLTVLVGNGSCLRAVKLKLAGASSALSFAVERVHDEDATSSAKSQSYWDDQICQIVSNSQDGIAAIRRRKKLSIYDIQKQPQLLTSVPTGGYSSNPESRANFLACDMSRYVPHQVAAVDDDYKIILHDFTTKTSVHQINLPSWQAQQDLSTFSLNNSCGLQYAADSPQVFYCYLKNKLYFFDSRENLRVCGARQDSELHTFLDLASDVCAKAISEQRYFTADSNFDILEYISCLKSSTSNSNYFYVGTRQRLMMMDWRVPKHPVINLSHGMQSAAAYIDVVPSSKFETVIVGSQRKSEIYCAVLDHAHVSCEGRTECGAQNPILLSYPRHLSSAREFLQEANENGFQFPWQDDQEAVSERGNAWSTGIAAGRLPGGRTSKDKPPGVFVVNSNAYGDLFYQEWIQRGDKRRHITNRRDVNWKKCISKWQNSLKSFLKDAVTKQSNNMLKPEDCSLLVEVVGKSVKKATKVCSEPFSSAAVRHHEEAEEKVAPVHDTCESLKKYRGDRVAPFVKVWEEEWQASGRRRRNSSMSSTESMLDRLLGLETTEDVTAKMLVESNAGAIDIKVEPEDEDEPEEIYEDFTAEVEIIEEDRPMVQPAETVDLHCDHNNLVENQDSFGVGLDYGMDRFAAGAGNMRDFMSSTHIGGGFGHSIFDAQGTSFSFYGDQDQNNFGSSSQMSTSRPSESSQRHSQISSSSAKRAGF